jgi:predicted HTH domain antitoxin
MALHLDISESVAGSLRLPVQEIEPRLRAELALALYAQGILPFGKASELAIPRHYADDELAQDLDYARGQ